MNDDVYVLVGVEAVGLFVEIGAVAEEIGRVVANLHVPDEPLHVAHVLGIRHPIVVLDVDYRPLCLRCALRRGEKRQQ